MDKVDGGSISLLAGVDLSYLSLSQQKQLEQVMLAEKVQKITPAQAKELRQTGAADGLTEQAVKEILGCIKPYQPATLTIKLPVDGLLTSSELNTLKKQIKAALEAEDKTFVTAMLERLKELL